MDNRVELAQERSLFCSQRTRTAPEAKKNEEELAHLWCSEVRADDKIAEYTHDISSGRPTKPVESITVSDACFMVVT